MRWIGYRFTCAARRRGTETPPYINAGYIKACDLVQAAFDQGGMKKIAILNGPNLDRLGKREPEIYGRATLADLETALRAEFGNEAQLEFFQSNHEGALIDKIASLADARFDGVVINGGAFTHTSVALRDALMGAHLPTVEVHISNIYKREEFRHTSLTAPACIAVITGLGLEGYHAAVRFLLKR